MLRLWNRVVIGGESGKREAAWGVFLFFAALLAWASWNEAQGRPMPETFALLTISVPVAVAAVLAAHGMEHLSRKGWPRRSDT